MPACIVGAWQTSASAPSRVAGTGGSSSANEQLYDDPNSENAPERRTSVSPPTGPDCGESDETATGA